MLLTYLTVMHKVARRLDNLVGGGAVQSCANLVLQEQDNNMWVQNLQDDRVSGQHDSGKATHCTCEPDAHQKECLLGADNHFTCRRWMQLPQYESMTSTLH